MNRNKSSKKSAAAPKAEEKPAAERGRGRGRGRGGASRGTGGANRGVGNAGGADGARGAGGRGGRGRGRGGDPLPGGLSRRPKKVQMLSDPVHSPGQPRDSGVSGPLEPEFGWRPNPHKEKKVVKPVVPGREAVQISTKSEDMLVDLLKNIDVEDDVGDYDDDGYGEEDEYDDEAWEETLQRLMALGFKHQQASQALDETEGDYDAAVEWLCLNLDNSELPKGFAQNKQAKLKVYVNSGSNDKSDTSSFAYREMLRRFVPNFTLQYGFDEEHVERALPRFQFDEKATLYYLLTQLYPENLFDASLVPMDDPNLREQLNEQVQDEIMALESIFAPEEYTKVDDELLQFPMKLDSVEGQSIVEVIIPKNGYYPYHPALVAYKNKFLDQEILLHITKRIVEEACNYAGSMMIYSIVSWVQSNVSRIVRNYEQDAKRLKIQELKQAAEQQKELVRHAAQARQARMNAAEEKALAAAEAAFAEDDVRSANLLVDESSAWNKEYTPRRVSEAEKSRRVAKSQQMKDEMDQKLHSDNKYKAMQNSRKQLPAFGMKEAVLHLIKNNQVILVAGATGCGKTTQVGQFIMDDLIRNGKGADCNIICTQPRRFVQNRALSLVGLALEFHNGISAIGVAQRVADERAEQLGLSVGYSIRLESVRSEETRLLFVTTGVLLRKMHSDPYLDGVSHLILDEVHERDVNSDFLLVILRELLPKRPDLKVVLMSATINAEVFSNYFGGCPTMEIPGRTFPVQEYFLEDVIEQTKYVVEPDSQWSRHSSERKQSVGDIREKYPKHSIVVHRALELMDQSRINYDLVDKLITHINEKYEEGGVLVFLPGMQDITTLMELLLMNPTLKKAKVLPLHSALSTEQQQEIFDRPPPGYRKVVLSTNIAETSITIDDIVFVIDTCRVKEKGYDPVSKIETLQETWSSQASSRQRKGRAGRVKPGFCWYMITSHRMAKLSPFQLPEMKRVPLDELCLQVRLLKLGSIRDFMSRALEPPSVEAIAHSIFSLKELGALDANENLTALGYHLAQLPVSGRLGKMMLFGCMFQCLEPILTICASLSTRSPFAGTFEKKDEIDAVRRRWDNRLHSDHLTSLKAFDAWKVERKKGGKNFCYANYLSMNALGTIEETRKHLHRMLLDIGFASRKDKQRDNENSANMKLVRAVLCAGLYPNICKIEPHFDSKGGVQYCRFKTRSEEVYLHPTSVNHNVKTFSSKWLVYHEKVKTSKVYLRDSTMISIFPLLLFGGDIRLDYERGEVVLDDWMRFEIAIKIGVLMGKLRKELDKVMLKKIVDPNADTANQKVIKAIVELISSERIEGE